MSSPRMPDPFSNEKLQFFKVPLGFQQLQAGLSQSEKDIYIYFLIQMKYKKTKKLEASNSEIRYWTGIKNKVTVVRAIRDLIKHGLIENVSYQNNNSNIYEVNLSPHVNQELISKMEQRKEIASKAKKESIENGEKGKFEKGNIIRSEKDRILNP